MASSFQKARIEQVTDGPIDGIVVIPTPEDLLYLRNKLEQSKLEWEDLDRRITFVIKHNGVVSGCIAARLVFQVEPLYLTPEFKRDAGPVTIRRACFKLLKSVFGWLSGPDNKTGIRWSFCYVTGKEMQKLAVDYGMLPVYTKGKFFVKDF